MAVGGVVSIAGFAAVALRTRVLATFGPKVVIIPESTLCSVGSHTVACNVQEYNSHTSS